MSASDFARNLAMAVAVAVLNGSCMSAYDNNDMHPDVFEPDDGHPLRDDFSIRAARHRARQQPPGIAPVYPIHMRNHPSWSGNNEFGFETGFAPDANNSQMVLKLGEWDAPEVWSVMLGMDVPDVNTAGFSVLAEVTAGAGGTTETFEVDWNQGTAFSIVCNTLIVNAKYDNVIAIPDDLRLRVLVGRKPKTGNLPSRTIEDALNIGAARNYRIPKYAKTMQLLPGAYAVASNDVYAATFLIFFMQTNGSGITSHITGQQLLALNGGGKIEVPGSANFMRVVNNTGNIVFYNMRFDLAL